MRNAKIIVVDDNEAVLRSLRTILSHEFKTIVTVSSPVLLPALLRNGDVDMVLLDMNFGAGKQSGGEGLFWLDRILELKNPPAVILITAFGDIELAVSSLKRGASDFIVKPWDNEKLIQTLVHVWEHRMESNTDKASSVAESLINALLKKYTEAYAKPLPRLTAEAVDKLSDMAGRGDLALLQQIVERTVLLVDKCRLDADDFYVEELSEVSHPCTLEDMERQFIAEVLKEKKGNLTLAAQQLDISRQTLYNKMRKYGLKIIGIVSLIVFLALLGSVLLITGTSYFLSFVCLCIILLITLLLIRWMNGINRKIATFFESVRNGDTALRYPNKTNDPFVKDLYTEMNRIILLFSQNQSEMEEKRLYYESILRVLTHEIRNSITPIRSLSADLLKYSDTYTPKQLREGLEVIHGQAQNLSAFLDSYHRLTHLPEPERTEVPITSLFQKMERLLCAEPGSDRIRFSSAEALTVRVDQNLIVLALINLIRNALQAIEGQADGIVSVEALKTDGRVYITITDNGPGISPELLSAIFMPFFSTKSGGSGIGLSISHRIMRLHGGDLTVDSLPGVRTEFRMKL